MTTAVPTSTAVDRPVTTTASRLARHQSVALLTAFSLSTVHTVHAHLVGIADPSFTVTTPAAWAFYLVGFGSVLLARSDDRRVLWGVVVYLVALLAVSVFVYPSSFVPARQTPFGWFENDVYVALLGLALYLGVQRLRRVDA